MTPLKVKVKTGKKWVGHCHQLLSCILSIRFHSDPRLIYPMSSSPRGLALIINNIEFTSPEIYPFRWEKNIFWGGKISKPMFSWRKGAEVDSENLAELFTQLGFKVDFPQRPFIRSFNSEGYSPTDWMGPNFWFLSRSYLRHFVKKVEKHLNLGRTETFRVLIDFAARTEHKDADMVKLFHLKHLTNNLKSSHQ